jgi:hypothetical protein
MSRVISGACFVLLLTFVLPALGTDDTSTDKSKKDAKPKQVEKKAKEKLPRGEVIVGRLVAIQNKEHYLTVSVTKKIAQQNAQAAQNIANYQQQLVGNKDINSIRSIRIEIAKNQANLVTYKDETKRLEISLPDEVKIRTMILPVEYDDKGKPRKLTSKELKELKGSDSSLPGYTADLESLKPDQELRVHLVKQKKRTSKDKEDADSKDRREAIMIVILAERKK